MTVNITRNGHNRYGVTLDDRSVILSVGEIMDGDDAGLQGQLETNISLVELFEFGGVHGVLVRTDLGVYGSDINGSGGLRLIRVENQFGEILHA